MENNYFITDEPNELVANLSTPGPQWGKLSKLGYWKNGYGKYTVAILLLYAVDNVYHTGLPMITVDNWVDSLFIYAWRCIPLLIAFNIYKGSFKSNKKLLVINSKGILYNEETFLWNDILSFQLSLEKAINKGWNHAYYLHLRTKNKTDHIINISMFNKNFGEIHNALLKNQGKYEVKDLGFTQIL